MEEQPQPPQSSPPPQYGFEQSKADQSHGSVPWFLLPFMILIRPGRFMLSWGIHANIFWILVAAWLIGSSGMINTVVNRTRFSPDSLPISIDSWTTVWMIILGFGILRGIISYGIGGLWTWLRLRICGIRGNEWKRSTRIFCLSSLADDVPSLLALAYFTMQYDTLRDFIAQPVGLANLVAALFMLIAPIIGLVGVLACYKVRVVWATILFFVIPISWRLVMLGGLLISPGSILLPDTQHPVSHTDELFQFDHPKDWSVFPEVQIDKHARGQVMIQSDHAQASIFLRIMRVDGIDPNEHDVSLIEQEGYTVVKKSVLDRTSMNMLVGYGELYDLEKDGQVFEMFHLLVVLDQNHWVFIRSLASKWYRDASIYALEQVGDSLVISSKETQAPDVENQKHIVRDWFVHQAPGNWRELLDSHAQFEGVEQQAFRKTYIRFTIYDRPGGGGGDGGPDKELSTVLENGMHKDQMITHSPMNSWLGFEGLGAKGTIWQPLWGVHDFRVLFVPLKDGRVLGIKKYQAESSADLTDPGFDLIESTFKLLVEPAPIEP